MVKIFNNIIQKGTRAMITLERWAKKHGVSARALCELLDMFGIEDVKNTKDKPGGSEASAQLNVRLEAARHGVSLWRNNVVVLKNDQGVPVRCGLANESKAMNEKNKSSDLIGITPHIVTASDLGLTLGIFTSYETKRPGWKYKGTSREVAQLHWIELVASLGGIAKFTTGPEDIWPLKLR